MLLPFLLKGAFREEVKMQQTYEILKRKVNNYVASEDLNKESDYAEAMFALADLDGLDLCRHEDFFYDLCRIQKKSVSDHISEDVRKKVWEETYMLERIRDIGRHLHFPEKMQNALNEVLHDCNSYDDWTNTL